MEHCLLLVGVSPFRPPFLQTPPPPSPPRIRRPSLPVFSRETNPPPRAPARTPPPFHCLRTAKSKNIEKSASCNTLVELFGKAVGTMADVFKTRSAQRLLRSWPARLDPRDFHVVSWNLPLCVQAQCLLTSTLLNDGLA